MIELIAEQAAQWMLELESNENCVTTNKGFLKWLKASPVHIHEFLLMTNIMLEIENKESMQSLDDIIKCYHLESNIIPLAIKNKITKESKNAKI